MEPEALTSALPPLDDSSTHSTNKDKQLEPEALTTAVLPSDDSAGHTTSNPGTPPTDIIATIETPTVSTAATTTTRLQHQKESISGGTSIPKEKKPSAKKSLNEDLSREAKKKKPN